MKETKNARFRRVAEARVNKIIRMLRLLGNCSGTNTYAYDADAVEQIFTALQIELDQARKRFSENGRTGRKRFSLSQAPTPDTVSYPHITLPCRTAHIFELSLMQIRPIRPSICIYCGMASRRSSYALRNTTRSTALPRALHRRLHLRCGGHTVLWAISARRKQSMER